jgi:hypothetical protein
LDSIILFLRLQTFLNSHIPPFSGGFRKGRVKIIQYFGSPHLPVLNA